MLAACGGGGGTAPSSASAPSAPPGSSTRSPGPGTTVTVSEREFSLQLSHTSFTPGTYTFVADDIGKTVHALAISGPGVPTTKTQTISPGDKVQLTVTLQVGTYELWCPVDEHKQLGMDTRIKVGGTGSAAPPSSAGGSGGGS